ncbi:MAG: hypothetical protein WBW33_05785 [Bryobacteraceae bacterium]
MLDTWADFASYRSASEARGESFSETEGPSTTDSTSQIFTEYKSTSHGTGSTESIHHRSLVLPDEVGRIFARIDDGRHPAYPGLALVIRSGVTNVYDAVLTVE